MLIQSAEAKFKSHNKIVCHREAINGDRFITDAGRVMAAPPAEVKIEKREYRLN